MDLLHQLQITGTLRVERDGEAFTVRSDGRRVSVDVASLGTARRLLADALAARASVTPAAESHAAGTPPGGDAASDSDDGGERSNREALRGVARRIERAGYTLELRIDGDRVLELGAGVKPNLVTRALGLGPVRLKARNLLGALLG